MAAGPVAVSASWCSSAALVSRRSPTPAAKAALSRIRGAGLSSKPRSTAADTVLLPSSFAATRRTQGLSEAARQEHRSEEHTSELQSQSNLVCRLLLEKKKHKLLLYTYQLHHYT